MRKNELIIGGTYDLHGDLVEVTAITPEGVVVEGPQNGEELVRAGDLKEFVPTTREPSFYD